ncbi:MAG: prolipoprotein diacylglyceryl transferase [Chloroflexi bacterium]|nr:MAG: prolipoprotein diacylglyceryl transferase [Chloroflexota bacterium]HDN80027.1 prolipoprotein diacylglyceryl transferase [Chloroflexota bacterium]
MFPDPVAFRIGPLAIRWYGLLIMLGTLLAAFIASREAQRRGDNPDHVWNALTLCIIFGLIGARLYHVFSSPAEGVGWSYYRQHPIEIFAFWKGGFQGLGIFGAFVGGLLGILVYTRLNKLNFWRWADLGVMVFPLGQAIGRWGNFFNQELYGYPTTLPWGIKIDAAHRYGPFVDLEKYPVETTRFHPTFLYESILCFIVFGLLMYINRRFEHRLKDGDLLLLYCIFYPMVRIITETQRPDAWRAWGIPVAQLISAGLIVVALAILIYRHRRG